MNWLSYSVIALVTFSGYDLLSRRLGVESKNPRAFGAVYYFVAAFLCPLLLFAEPLVTPSLSGVTLVLTALGLFAWILFGRIEYMTHKYVEASTLTILLRLGPIITFALSALFLAEAVTVPKLIGLLLTVFASILVIGVPSVSLFRKNKDLRYGVLLAGILGVAWTFDKVLSPIYGVVVFGFLTFFVPALANTFVPPLPLAAMRSELQHASWKLIVLGLLNIIGYGAMTKALIIGDATNVIPIATSTPPLVVLGGVLFLGERTDVGKKILAVLLVLVAIYLMR